MKILSVIIPLYNSAQWLEKCLDSVINQDIPADQLEIICINDGSPDNSADIVRQYTIHHTPYTIILLDQENQGPSGARNTGMKAATGKYLMFVDPDDYVEPNTFGGLVKQMEDEQLDMLRFNYQIVDENYQPVEKRDFEKAFDYTSYQMSGAEFLANRLDIACNIWRYIYRTEIITKNEIWCYTGDYYDDTPWLPLVLMKAKRLNICDTIVYDYQERSDSLVKGKNSRLIQRKIDGSLMLIQILEKQLDNMENYLPKDLYEDIKVKIVSWYRKIETHMVVNMLTLIAVYQFAERGKYITELNKMSLFPLTYFVGIKKIEKKIKLINISPNLMVWLVRLKRQMLAIGSYIKQKIRRK